METVNTIFPLDTKLYKILFGVNQNPTQQEWTQSPKAYAQVYIDDAALGAPLCNGLDETERPYINWDAVELAIFGNIA